LKISLNNYYSYFKHRNWLILITQF
jgi:hypothetical protein